MRREPNVSERTIMKKDRYGNQTTETVKYDTKSSMDNVLSGFQQNYMDFVPKPSAPPMPQGMISQDLNDPTNRDSVPAVLTPGEFVLNKEASQMYAPQIEAMNNHGLQQRHQENVAMMNGGHVPVAPLAGLNAGGRAEAAHIANQRKLVDWQNKGDYSSTPWFRPSPGPDIAPQHKPNNPVIKPHSRAGAPYYNTGGEVPKALGVPEIQMYNDGDLVIPGFFLGGLVDAAKELFGGTPTQVQDPYAGYADYTQQQFVDEAQNPSAGVAPAGAEYPGLPAGYTTPPGQPGIPDVPRGSLAGQQAVHSGPNVGSTENKIAQVNNQLGFQTNTGGLLGTGADPLPSIDLTPPPPMSDQSLIQNSSQAMEQTEDNLSAISQGIDPNNPWANVPRGSVNNQDYAANQYRGVGVPPMGSQTAIPEPVGTGQFNAVPATQEVSQQQPQASNVYDAIAQHEGFREEAYDDGTGVWTIGFGRTYNSDGTKVQPGQKSTRDAEQAFLVGRVDEDKKYVQDYAAKHGYNWDDNQINALTSFTYNLGKGGLDKLTNNGKRSDDEIASKLPEYNKAGGEVMAGLTNRRNDEAALFSGSFGNSPTTTTTVPHISGVPNVQSGAAALRDAAFAGDENAQERLFELSDAGDPLATQIIDEFYARQDAGTLAEAGSLLPYVAGTGEGRTMAEENLTVPFINQGLIPPAPVETGLPTAKASSVEIMQAGNKKAEATRRIREADDEAVLAEEGIRNAQSVSELERFQRMAEQAAQKKAQGEVLAAEANTLQATIDARAAQATADSAAITDRTKAEVETLRNKALIDAGFEKTEVTPIDAEGVVAAEAEIANQTGVNVTDEQAANTKLQVTDALAASGNKEMADSITGTGVSSLGGKGTDPAAVKKLLTDVDGPSGDGKSDGNTPGKLEGVFKNVFKDLFGAGEISQIITKGLVLYAGARLTGLSGNQALAFAAKSALQDGANYHKQQADIKTAEAAAIAAANKDNAEELKWRKHKSVELAGKYTNESIDAFIQTGDSSVLAPKIDPNDTALGPATGKKVWSAQYGDIEVRRNANGSGEFVRLPNGRELPLKEFQQIGLESGRLVEDYNPVKHDFKTIEENFHKLASDSAANLTKANAQRGAKDGKQEFLSIPQTTARVASNYYKELISKYPTADATKLQEYMYDGITKYQEDLNAFQQGRSSIEPSSPEDYFKAQEVIIENDLPYDEVVGASAFDIAGIFDNINNDAAKVLIGNDSPTAGADYLEERKEGFQELSTLWTLAKKDPETMKYWKSIASSSKTATPFTAFSNALLNSDEGGDQSVAGVREVSKFVDDNLPEFQKRMDAWRKMREKKRKQ